ncbi:Alpha/Beta hydrolase protein [Haematococcus lacustris]
MLEQCRSYASTAQTSHRSHRCTRTMLQLLHNPHTRKLCMAESATFAGPLAETGQQGAAGPSPRAAEVEELYWNWKWRSRIRYFKAGASGPAVLLLHGFGVGAWHFEHNISHLARTHQVYAVDLLGQGRSWPQHPLPEQAQEEEEPPASQPLQPGLPSQEEGGPQPPGPAGPLCYSITTWTQQLQQFLEQVVGGPAYVAGNSLGGFVAVNLAAQQPDLVRGLLLLNATPFWSFRPPMDQPQGLWGILGFDGSVPAPKALKRAIEVLWWDSLRSRSTVSAMLAMVYSHKAVSADQRLVERILEATEHPGALDAFASIVLSPKSPHDFDAMLRRLQCSVSLVYGRQDPWVVPMWGQRALHVLRRAGHPAAMYLELDPAGHCPHHEAPAASNAAMVMCLRHMEELRAWQDGRAAQSSATMLTHAASASPDERLMPTVPLEVGQSCEVREDDGRVVRISHVNGAPRILPEYFWHAVWRLQERLSGSATEAAPARSGAAS